MNKSEVKQLQRSLRETTSPGIGVDGVLGNQTTVAIENFAVVHGLDVENAKLLLKRYADVRFVSDDAFQEAASSLNVPESYVRAIAEVESAGESFLKDGRVKILFERHWFYKKFKEALQKVKVREHVIKKLDWVTSTAIHNADTILGMVSKTYPNICNENTGGYQGNEAEWNRLELAMRFDVEAACQSVSMGGYQIMGFNHKACGYATAKEMLLKLAASESAQFLAVIAFIKANPSMLTALRKADWASFAREYNGKGYAKNKYDTRLASSESKWRDTILA